MTPERWAFISQIFATALETQQVERGAFLDAACGGDARLRSEIEALLAENEQPRLGSPLAELLERRCAEPVRPGQIVNGYRILERLGAGGMGLVYKAVDTTLGRHDALKFLPVELGIDETARGALVNEARAASALDHPNIGTIYGIEVTPSGQQFIVMAYYEGQTLAQKLPNGPLPPREAAEIALQVATGLAEAHAHKIVHRDVKPSNIFLTRKGLVKILDFGLARVILSATSTRSVNISGTAVYMSPEQAQGGFLDARTDLWSLGAVIYEMITGRRAFAADDVPATLYAIVNSPPPNLADDVPPALQKIIYHALAKSPKDRYQSAAEMIRDLEQVSAQGAQRNDPTATTEEISGYRKLAATRPRPPKWSRFVRWLIAPVLAIVLVVGFFTLRSPPGNKPAAYEPYLRAASLIQRYEKPENLDKAIVLLRGAVKADPNFTLAYASLGEAYWQKARLTNDRTLLVEAESHAKRALQLDDGLAPVHIVMGGVQSALGNRELAQEHYRRALRLDPANTAALSGLAGEYAALSRTHEAEELYRRAVALRPEAWEGHNNLGLFLRGQGEPEQAAEQFRRVIELTPNSAVGYVNLAVTLIDGGKIDEAETALKKAVENGPPSYAVYANLGTIYYQKRFFAQAAEATNQALRLNDRDWRMWTNLAVINRWLGDDAHALKAYRRALPLIEKSAAVEPNNADLQVRLAEIHAYSGARGQAESRAQAALALARREPLVLLGCADAYAALGDLRRAVTLANDAVASGLTLLQLDQDPEARRFRMDPNFTPPRR